jgi:hypothetical protein
MEFAGGDAEGIVLHSLLMGCGVASGDLSMTSENAQKEYFGEFVHSAHSANSGFCQGGALPPIREVMGRNRDGVPGACVH